MPILSATFSLFIEVTQTEVIQKFCFAIEMKPCSSLMNDAQVENPTGPNWLELPKDVIAKILKSLGPVEILKNARYVCTLWWNICKEPLMWRTIHMPNLNAIGMYSCVAIENMCCHAIDLSRGHLQDFKTPPLCSDVLLKHVLNSTNQIRRLVLSNSWFCSQPLLIEVVNKLPLLEELDISFTSLGCHFLEAVGRCCPRLSTLKFNKKVYCVNSIAYDDEAFAVGKSVVNVRHLELVGNMLSNDGLLAILEGCSSLELLDLRGCYNVDLRGSLGKKCHQQIQYLRLPDDHIPQNLCYKSLDGYAFHDNVNSLYFA